MGIFFFFTFLVVSIFFFSSRRRHTRCGRDWSSDVCSSDLWLAGAVSGLAAIVAMECGWVVTEVGRQPWVVYRLQITAAAATTNGGVITSLNIIIVLYAVVGAATLLILRLLARRWRS